MDELILRVLQGRATPEEEGRLLRWRRENPENERRYRELEALWSLTGSAEPGGHAGPPPSPDAIFERVEAARSSLPHDLEVAGLPPREAAGEPEEPEEGVRRSRPARARRASALLLAACFVLVGFGLGLFVGTSGAPGPSDATFAGIASTEITTGAGEMTTVTMDDGTAIRVGPRSALRLGLEDGQPVAWLSGRAFFGVVPDPERSFTVRTPHGEATALGTRFEVRSEDRDFQVFVVEGSVRVSAAGATLDLSEGLLSRSSDGSAPTTSTVEDRHTLLDWMGQALLFRSTPLETAVEEIEYRYGVEVVVDPRLRDMTVTATFTDQTFEYVALVVCETVGAECLFEDGLLRMAASGGSLETSSVRGTA